MELIILIAGLVVIALTSHFSERIGVASPLILLALGAGFSFLPQIQPITLDPEILLEAVLPPLLFGAAARMPVMDFRRDLTAVAGLAIGLVALTAVALGFALHWLVPSIPLAWAIALGAVISPTDAVAVSITKRQGVAHRIITVLEGEGLFNDATALVLLASASAAAMQVDGGGLDLPGLVGDFIVSLVIAVVVGAIVGELGIRIRARISDPATDTVFSFAMPFLASVPTHALGGSGLVAAVCAGLVVSYERTTRLPAANRIFAQLNWRTVELMLEGFVFLTMGLQAYGILEDVQAGSSGLGIARATAVALALGALTVVVRAVFVAPLLGLLSVQRRKHEQRLERDQERLAAIEAKIKQACELVEATGETEHFAPPRWQKIIRSWRLRLELDHKAQRRRGNTLAYLSRESFGAREGAVIVWAGMRGAVTLAAAQTLPLDTPGRSFLLLIALLVSAGSLALQGLTLPWLIRVAKPAMAADAADEEERERLLELLGSAFKQSALAAAISEGRTGPKARLARQLPGSDHHATDVAPARDTTDVATDGVEHQETRAQHLAEEQVKALALEAIRDQREALIDARDEGAFSSQALQRGLERLDYEEIMLTSFQR